MSCVLIVAIYKQSGTMVKTGLCKKDVELLAIAQVEFCLFTGPLGGRDGMAGEFYFSGLGNQISNTLKTIRVQMLAANV